MMARMTQSSEPSPHIIEDASAASPEPTPPPEPADGPIALEEPGTAPAPAGPTVDLGVLEALLFATPSPLTPQRLGELLGVKGVRPLQQALRRLNEQYEQTGRAFRVEQVAGGYQLLTLPCYGEHLQRLHHREADAKLTKAALETLAIIAYRQPILRADIEAIRGVACGETIRSLMEKRLVRIAGRAEEPGRPILYGTTKRFLEVFGLNSLKDLPQVPDLPSPPPSAAG
jgi:segregation and condensation protein B